MALHKEIMTEIKAIWEDESGMSKIALEGYVKAKLNFIKSIEAIISKLIPATTKAAQDANRALAECDNAIKSATESAEAIKLAQETESVKNNKVTWAADSAAKGELDRVKNSVIIRSDTEFDAPFKKKLRDQINVEYKNITKKAKPMLVAEMEITSLKSPEIGQHKDKYHYRLTMEKPNSKKALFALLRKQGNTTFKGLQVRNEVPGFLFKENDRAGLFSAKIRQKNTEAKTRISINARSKSIEIQVAFKTEGDEKLKFSTVATSLGDETDGIPGFMFNELSEEQIVTNILDKIRECFPEHHI